jgi:hypothetical protein
MVKKTERSRSEVKVLFAQEGDMRRNRSAFLAACAGGALIICPSASAQAVQPGEWSMTVTIKSMDMKGMTPAMASAMKEPKTEESCVTPEKAAKGISAMTSQNGGDCTVKSHSVVGGVLDLQAMCGAGASAIDMHMHGPFSSTSYSLTTDSTRGGARPMKMTVLMEAKRTGACH